VLVTDLAADADVPDGAVYQRLDITAQEDWAAALERVRADLPPWGIGVSVDDGRFLVLPDRNARIAFWTKRLVRPLFDRQMLRMGARIHGAEQQGGATS
jgi:hypothetical protein